MKTIEERIPKRNNYDNNKVVIEHLFWIMEPEDPYILKQISLSVHRDLLLSKLETLTDKYDNEALSLLQNLLGNGKIKTNQPKDDNLLELFINSSIYDEPIQSHKMLLKKCEEEMKKAEEIISKIKQFKDNNIIDAKIAKEMLNRLWFNFSFFANEYLNLIQSTYIQKTLDLTNLDEMIEISTGMEIDKTELLNLNERKMTAIDNGKVLNLAIKANRIINKN